MYEPTLRADYSMFDTYPHRVGRPRLACRVVAQFADRDARITEALVAEWAGHAAGPFELERVAGPHMFPMDRAQKQAWLAQIVAHLERTRSPGPSG